MRTLATEEIGKSYRGRRVVNGVSLRVDQGEVVGLLGPNGAGKSTFIGCLYGSVERSGGDLRVFGYDPARDARRIKERIGVVPQENALDEELTVLENMRLYARFQSVRDPSRRIEELLDHMSLEHKRDAQIRSLSGGMKRRLTFVRALLSDPELLILDEPTTGLDPTRTRSIHQLVRHTQQKFGLTSVMVSHDVPQVFEVSDQVAFMHEGKMELVGSVSEVMSSDDQNFKRFLAGKASGEDELSTSRVGAIAGR